MDNDNPNDWRITSYNDARYEQMTPDRPHLTSRTSVSVHMEEAERRSRIALAAESQLFGQRMEDAERNRNVSLAVGLATREQNRRVTELTQQEINLKKKLLQEREENRRSALGLMEQERWRRITTPGSGGGELAGMVCLFCRASYTVPAL